MDAQRADLGLLMVMRKQVAGGSPHASFLHFDPNSAWRPSSPCFRSLIVPQLYILRAKDCYRRG